MINELTWDSNFFKRKIGELKIVSESPQEIETALKNAKVKEFKYIVCKIHSQHTALIKALENAGFYLSDIGVIWEVEAGKFLHKETDKNSFKKPPINVATLKDIPSLKEMIKSLFGESRFYSDPFFSKDEADRLYQAWIENSINGKVADIVFCIPEIGFITCKKSSSTTGEIPLIGIKKDFRGKGLGTILIAEAIKWFKTQSLHLVSVRTQLNNINAMNFYAKLGFHIKGYDIVFAKVL